MTGAIAICEERDHQEEVFQRLSIGQANDPEIEHIDEKDGKTDVNEYADYHDHQWRQGDPHASQPSLEKVELAKEKYSWRERSHLHMCLSAKFFVLSKC